MGETVGIISGVLALVIAVITYYKTFHSKPKFEEERITMLGMFKANEFICLELQEMIQDYMDKNDGANHEFTEGFTFQEYLNSFKTECQKGFSNEIFEDLKNNPNYTKSDIEMFLRGFERNNETYKSLKGYIMLKR